MRKLPKNGLYFSRGDATEYGNQFTDMYNTCHETCYTTNSEQLIKTITFIITEACNLNCTYCYETCKTNRIMSKEVAYEGLKMLFNKDKIGHYMDLNQTKGYIIEFFGGEPFLHPELIDFIASNFLQMAYEKNKEIFAYSHFSTTTNGTLYFEPEVTKVINKYLPKFSVGITIDGNKELHDTCRRFYDGSPSYDLVEKAVKAHNLKRLDVNDTKLTIAPENVNFLADAVIHLWENVNVQMVNANCVFENVWSLEHAPILYDQLVKIADYLLKDKNYQKYYFSMFDESYGRSADEEALKRNYCGGNGNMLAITPDGKLYPCSRFAPYSLKEREPFEIGNVYDGIDKRNNKLDALKEVTLRSQSEQKCLDCNVSSGCSLCTAYNYQIYGTPNKRATFICDNHKATVEACRYYFNKLYIQLGLSKVF